MAKWTNSQQEIDALIGLENAERVLNGFESVERKKALDVVGCALDSERWVWGCIMAGGWRIMAVCPENAKRWVVNNVDRPEFFAAPFPLSWITRATAVNGGTPQPAMRRGGAVGLKVGSIVGAIMSRKDFRVARVEAVDADGRPAKLMLRGDKEAQEADDVPFTWFPITKWPQGAVAAFEAKGGTYATFRFYAMRAANLQKGYDKRHGIVKPKPAQHVENVEDYI